MDLFNVAFFQYFQRLLDFVAFTHHHSLSP
jgi:hypothetical protein